MQRFHFNWVHRPGRRNVANPLSCNPDVVSLNVLIAVMTRRAAAEARGEASSSPASAADSAVSAVQKRKGNSVSPASGANSVPVSSKRRKINSGGAAQQSADTPALLLLRLVLLLTLERYLS